MEPCRIFRVKTGTMKRIFLVLFSAIPFASPAQNVGIGTNSPEAPLHIKDASLMNLLKLQGNGSFISFYDNSNNYKSYIWDNGNQLQLGTAGSNTSITMAPAFGVVATFQSNGNVGIGTSPPGARLHVDAGAADEVIRMNSSGYPFISFYKSLAVKGFIGMKAFDFAWPEHFRIGTETGSGLPVRIYADGALRMSFNATGDVSVGDAFNAVDLSVNGFTKLGTTAPAIQVMYLTGTTAPTAGGVQNFYHGLSPSKILAVNLLVEVSATNLAPPNYSATIGRQYQYIVNGANIEVYNDPANSSFILNKPVRIMITYTN